MTSFLVCQECKKTLYSHIDLSKSTKPKLSPAQVRANCELVAEEGFHSGVFVCDDCFSAIVDELQEHFKEEDGYSQEWGKAITEYNEAKTDAQEFETAIQGLESTKANEESLCQLRKLQQASYDELAELKDVIIGYYDELLYKKEVAWYDEYNRMFAENEGLLSELKRLQYSVKDLSNQLQGLEKRNILYPLFNIQVNAAGKCFFNNVPFEYSISNIKNFNVCMGRLTLGVYLMTKQLLPEHSIIPIPYGNKSKIQVRDGNKTTTYNLYATAQTYYYEVDTSFKEGFSLLVHCFNDIYEYCVRQWPKLNDRYHYAFVGNSTSLTR